MTIGNGYDGPDAGPKMIVAQAVGAWQSLPKLVRLAVWLWSLIFVVSLIVGVVVGAVMVFALMAGLSG